MKKSIYMLAAVLVIVIASAFTFGNTKGVNSKAETKKTALISYKWFKINSNIAPGATVTNADATYLTGQDGPTPPTGQSCSAGSSYQCVSGFIASQVNASNQIVGPQKPKVEPMQRN